MGKVKEWLSKLGQLRRLQTEQGEALDEEASLKRNILGRQERISQTITELERTAEYLRAAAEKGKGG